MGHRVKKQRSEVSPSTGSGLEVGGAALRALRLEAKGGGLAVKQSNNKPSVGTGSMQCGDH